MVGRIAVTTALAGLSLIVTTLPALAETLSSESFAGARIPAGGWVIGSPKGVDYPCATAATASTPGLLPACREVVAGKAKADPDGGGAFRLTDNSSFNAGSLLFDKPIRADRGVTLEFDMYQYKGKPTTDKYGKRGADGIAFWIVDGSRTKVDPGAAGGGLGYNGLTGAFVGIGFDEFGNFSSTPGGPGGPGLKPNTVAVRGSASAGYKYLFGKSLDPVTHPIAVDAATRRADARRRVSVGINSDNIMNVTVDFQDGKGPQPVVVDLDLDRLPGQEPLPKTLKVGWAAATGNAAAVHEIGGFTARTLDADIRLTVGGDRELTAGVGGSVTLTATNALNAGISTGPVTVGYDVGAGLTVTRAAGPGWICTTGGQKVSCTRSDPLPPGAAYPPIALDVTAGLGAVLGSVPVTASLTGAPTAAVVGALTVKPAATKAVVKIASSPNPYAAGGRFNYTASAANPGPGPLTGARIAVTWPPAFKPLKWRCTASGGAVCPAAEGTGDVAATADLPIGAALTYTQDCQIPVGVTASFTASIALVAPGSGCTDQKPCVAAETNRPGLP
ncbi:hypothetical protein Aph01nite_23360 [Acrocarpospora phusangensis]|uniref:DUF11 domain-containing protein n=1 Tax=Acrocarpospora phusangensis TaxID=1070424 RepID=A0A919Q895_9ACTN|nr:hypothetical protein Aph01nite_23360 [Acrocarpospora phusangensis]